MRREFVLLPWLVGCTASTPSFVVLHAPTDEANTVQAFVDTIGDSRLGARGDAAPQDVGSASVEHRITLAQDDALCGDCYQLDRDGDVLRVRAGGILGRLYGASRALESMGFRFHHPHDTFVPEALALPAPDEGFGRVHTPETARRGLHLNMVEPTDAMFDLWVPSSEGAARVEAIMDWVIRNRGNHVQWVALDNVASAGPDADAWKTHTQGLLDAAHARGLTVGLALQLFGSGDGQKRFDLVDTGVTLEEQKAEMGPRLDRITDGLDFDLVNLSLGDLAGKEPAAIIASLEQVYDALQARQSGIELTTTLHPGDDRRVDHDERSLIDSFLATYADRPITHGSQTAMYYTLFDDPGGAYHHEDFDQHRDWVLGQLEAEEPVGYFPASAHGNAFDVGVPQYLPLYPRSRWSDLRRIQDHANEKGVPGLQDHVLSSGGWEWGYWQHDTATLRNTHTLSGDWCDDLRFQLGPHPAPAKDVADMVCFLGDAQHTALIEQRLTPFLSSFDAALETGFVEGDITQPERPLWGDIVRYTGDTLEAFRTQVGHLDAYAALTERVARDMGDLEAIDADPWLAEIHDGVQLHAIRARFAYRLAAAPLAEADLNDGGNHLDAADVLLTEAEAIVARRHETLHDPAPERLLTEGPNPTAYAHGYLLRADELCFWTREIRMARNTLQGLSLDVPSCGR